jgi:hypothetical protein
MRRARDSTARGEEESSAGRQPDAREVVAHRGLAQARAHAGEVRGDRLAGRDRDHVGVPGIVEHLDVGNTEISVRSTSAIVSSFWS